MRHIDPKDSSVMQEFERMAVEKGWVVQAALEPSMADQLRKEVNAVAELMPKTNAVLDLLVPLAETGGDSTDLRHALDALRASVMDPWLAKGFDEQGGEARSLYHTARSMLHAPEGQGHLWLEGLRAMRELLTKHWGQTVEKSPVVPQVTDEEMPPGMAEDGQAVADPGFIEGGGTSKFPMPSGLVRSEIDRLWKDLSPEGQKGLLQGLGAPPYVAAGTPYFYSFFGQPRNLEALRNAEPGWLKPGPDVMEKRRERAQTAPQKTPVDALWFVAPIVGRVQAVLQGLGFDIGAKRPDNIWGPRTNQAWNEFVRKYGLDKQYGLTVMPEIYPGDQSSPPRKDLEFAAEHGAALSVINEPGQKKKAPVSGLQPVETGPMPPEHIPAGYPADDGLAQTAATVMGELLSLANDLDEMNAHKAAAAVDDQLRLYKEAADKLYDITGETGEQLIGMAHPGGGPTMVPAQDEGGKVETIVEEHKKVREKATKPPTGKQAAFVAKQLVALANRLEGEGKKEAAMLVDKTLDELRRASRRPFVGSLHKEAQLDAAKLADILNGMSADLDVIATNVQDQSDVPGNLATLIEKTTPVRWGFRNYGAEFNEFAEEARDWLKYQANSASDIAADADELKDLVRNIGRLTRALAVVRAIYARVRPILIWGTWGPQAQKAFSDYLARANALQSFTGVASKSRAEEAAKQPSKKGPANKGNMASQLLQHTVNTIIATIQKYYRGSPTDRELLRSTFKNINIPGITGNGMTKALRILDYAKKMYGKEYSDSVKAQGYNDWLYNNVVKPMKRGLNLVTASDKSPMTKRADSIRPPEFGGIPAAKKRSPRQGRRPGGRSATQRDDISNLQTLMVRLGYPLGSTGPAGNGVDGVWGKHTAAAWEQLKKDVLAMNGPALPPAAPPKSRGPAPNAVRTAVQLAAYLLRVKGEASKAVNLAPGIKVAETAMGSPEAFLRALTRIPASGVKISGPGDVFGKENLAAASSLLTKYREELSKPGSPEAWNIWTKGGGEAGLRRRIRLVDSLLAQLRTAGSRVPPSGYGYEGGRNALPFGTLEGGPGTAGRGGPGTAGHGSGRGRMFDPTRAIDAFAKRLLPSDLLTVMISTSQFIKYANYVWPAGRRLREQGVPEKRVALRYLEYLKNGIGRLLGMLSPAVMRQMGVRGQQLKNNVLEVMSQMDPLERDLQYGSSY